jgi:hypothetical protein
MALEHVMADTMDVLWEAKSSRGELLTVSRFAELAKVDEATAAAWLRNASQGEIEILLNHYGMVLPQQLWDHAYRVANRKVTNTMYQLGAASYLGKAGQSFYPFGRPTFDFVSYQARQLASAMELGLNPTAQKALAAIPGIRRAVQPDVPFLGRTIQPSLLGRPIPLNVRLAARYGEVAGFAQSEIDKYSAQNPEAEDLRRFDSSGPLEFLERLTFIPFRSDQMLLDLGPGLGPIPSWGVHLLPTEPSDDDSLLSKFAAGVRDFAEALHPALEFDERQFDLFSQEGLAGGVDYLVPNSKGTPRRLGTDLVRWISVALAGDENPDVAYQQTIAALERWGRPVGYYKHLKANMGQMFADNGGPFTLDSDAYTDARANTIAATVESTVKAVPAVDQWLTRGALGLDTYDGEHIPQYKGLIDSLDIYLNAGFVGDSAVADLRNLWTLATDPATEGEHATAFVDRAKSLLFTLDQVYQDQLLVDHPEIVTNLISSYRCGTVGGSPINPDWCGPLGRVQIPETVDPRNAFSEGIDKGWIVERPEQDMFAEANERLARATSRRINALWAALVPLNENGNPPPLTSPRDINGEPTLPTRLRTGAVELSPQARALAATLGVDPGPGLIPYTDLQLLFATKRDSITPNMGAFEPAVDRGFGEMKRNALADVGAGEAPWETDLALLDDLDLYLRRISAELDTRDIRFDDAPDETQQNVRNEFRRFVNRGLLSTDEYAQWFEASYGPLDWQPPQPPPADELEYAFDVAVDEWEVVDGDTIRVDLADGPARIRLLGVNAADYNSRDPEINAAAVAQAEALEAILRDADTIQFGIWNPDEFGTFQEVNPQTGERRFLLWLYVDGEAVYNPEVFTFRDPTGVSSTGPGVPVTEGAI